MLHVNVPVADLRKEPKHLSKDFSNNPLRESQLIYGEKLKLIEVKNDWLYVEAEEQMRFSKERQWHGYPGFVHMSEVKDTPPPIHPQYISVAKDVTFGTFSTIKTSRPRCTPFSRKQFLKDALLFLDTPYLWGGKAFYSEAHTSSVDCSGLIYLLFRAQGKLIPRDAHDQYLKGTKISRETLQPGDLIFWSTPEAPERMKHVVIFFDDKHFLEAPMTGKKVRLIPLPSDFKKEKPLQSFPDREKQYHVFCVSLEKYCE